MDSPNSEKQYELAITLIQYYVELFWLIFGAFLLAETVLIGAIASIAKDGPDAFVFGGSILGLLLVIPWWATYRYNHALYALRVHEARSLEPSAGTFFTNGKELIDTGFSSLDSKIRIPYLARRLAPRHSVLSLIAIFAAAFLVILIGHWPSKWSDNTSTQASQTANPAALAQAVPPKDVMPPGSTEEWSALVYVDVQAQRLAVFNTDAMTQAPRFTTVQQCVEWGRSRVGSNPRSTFECGVGCRIVGGGVVCRDKTGIMR
jgi:hypothetical protein